MNVAPGGAVPLMRSTLIPELGEYETNFNIGDEQDMVFKEGDDGPFWLTPEEKIQTKNDTYSGPVIKKDLSKCEMLVELRKSGYDTSKKRYLKDELLELCKLQNIDTKKDVRKKEEGWVGKPKGMLHILFERGYIDKTKVIHPRSMAYSKNGKKSHYTNG